MIIRNINNIYIPDWLWNDDLESQIKQFKVYYKNISECKGWEDLLDKLQK